MKKICLAVVLMLCLPRLALAIDAGKANGLLTVGKEKIKLTHAYAHRYNNEEGLGDGPELRILLTDRELPVTVLAGFEGPRTLDDMARQGKVRGILLKLDPRKPLDHMHGTVLVPPSDPQASLIFFTSSGNDELKGLKVDALRVSGELQYSSDNKSFADLPPYSCDATFSAPLFHDEPLTAKLSGRAAIISPQAQALKAYIAALGRGDLEAARKLATENNWTELEAYKKKVSDEEFRKMLKSEGSSAAEIDRQISRVFVRGSHATIVLKGQGSTSVQSLVKQGGEWKVN